MNYLYLILIFYVIPCLYLLYNADKILRRIITAKEDSRIIFLLIFVPIINLVYMLIELLPDKKK